jgi:hypothetical protein
VASAFGGLRSKGMDLSSHTTHIKQPLPFLYFIIGYSLLDIGYSFFAFLFLISGY